MVFTMERIDIISRSGERQKICRIVTIKIRVKIICSGELGSLCCRWNAYHQNLDMIDEMKHLPGGMNLKKRFTIVLFAIPRRPEVCCLCLITAVENIWVQFVFWNLGPLSKTRLLRKRLPLLLIFAVLKIKVIHIYLSMACTIDRVFYPEPVENSSCEHPLCPLEISTP